MSIVSRFTGDAKMATISDIAQAGAYFIYRDSYSLLKTENCLHINNNQLSFFFFIDFKSIFIQKNEDEKTTRQIPKCQRNDTISFSSARNGTWRCKIDTKCQIKDYRALYYMAFHRLLGNRN